MVYVERTSAKHFAVQQLTAEDLELIRSALVTTAKCMSTDQQAERVRSAEIVKRINTELSQTNDKI